MNNTEIFNDNFLIFSFFEARRSEIEFLRKFVTQEIDIPMYDVHTSSHIDNLIFRGCVSLIDALGNFHGIAGKSNQDFINILINYGEDPLWGAVEPRTLAKHLQESRRRLEDPNRVEAFLTTLQKEKRFFEQTEICRLLKEDNLHKFLCQSDKDTIKNNMQHGTFAAIVYDYIRIPSVHGFGANPFVMSQTTFKGESLLSIILKKVLSSLNRISKERLLQGIDLLCVCDNIQEIKPQYELSSGLVIQPLIMGSSPFEKLEKVHEITDEMINNLVEKNVNQFGTSNTVNITTLYQLFLLNSLENIIQATSELDPALLKKMCGRS